MMGMWLLQPGQQQQGAQDVPPVPAAPAQAQQKKLQKLWTAQEKKYNNYLKSQGQGQ